MFFIGILKKMQEIEEITGMILVGELIAGALNMNRAPLLMHNPSALSVCFKTITLWRVLESTGKNEMVNGRKEAKTCKENINWETICNKVMSPLLLVISLPKVFKNLKNNKRKPLLKDTPKFGID